MVRLQIIEIFARGIPEDLLYILAVYAFSRVRIDVKRYLLSSVIFAVLIYFIRRLPIQYGVNTILTLITLIVLAVGISKIDTIKSIQSSIMIFILGFICEGINVFIIQYLFKADVKYIFNNPELKIIYGIPSLLLFGCIVGIYYMVLLKKDKLRDVLSGKNSK